LNLHATRRQRRILIQLWAIGLIGFTFLLCAPGDWLPKWIGGNGQGQGMGWGKLGHVGGYAALAALACTLSIREGLRLAALAVLSAHGFLTEFIQTFVPKRTGELSDVGLDHLGILFGLSLAWLTDRLVVRRERRMAAQEPDDDPAGENQDADLLRHRQPQEIGRRVVP
jgi:hypothetical protein